VLAPGARRADERTMPCEHLAGRPASRVLVVRELASVVRSDSMSAEVQRVIEQEIVGERAGALARAVESLELALRDLTEAMGSRQQRLREHLLEEAGERLWFVVVQREAIGLTRHDVLYEVLRVPPEVRRAMGPRRRR
jgi:Family of unknown function (DUF6665)